MNTPYSSRPGKPRLLDQVRETTRVKHYSPRTEDAYVGWIRRARAHAMNARSNGKSRDCSGR